MRLESLKRILIEESNWQKFVDENLMKHDQKEIQYRFAFDIGGTFTDCVLLGSNGIVFTTKVLSDHDNVVAPIAAGLRQMLEEHHVSISQISEVVVGATTAVTNLVIERKGAVTGLITTLGFRDVIEIGRELRFDLYDLTTPGPDPVVSRDLRVEIDERLDASGAVLKHPTDENIEQAVRLLIARGAKTIAVCLMHSFTNPSHEQQVKSIVGRIAPDMPVSLSCEVLGELREYERTVATVLNAYVMPMVGSYLSTIENGLRALGIQATLRIMQSNGGVISRDLGERMPIRMLESGPAAGALGAAHAAQRASVADVLAFDMGGTTAKACLIANGKPSVTTDFEAARQQRFKKGSGLPVRLPTVDLIEIGAGGGSIAHIDSNGLLKVGPESAGSNPGPAAYGLGGEFPTVTDAALIMGYLDPQGSLSGSVRLRLDLAEKAMLTHIANPLGISVIEAANGIHRIVCEHMATAAKIHAVEKGQDVRRYTLLAFGGAGPIHAREVARRIRCQEIFIPANAGVFSAFGLLVAPMKVDTVRTRFTRLDTIDWSQTEELLKEMEQTLSDQLSSADVPRDSIRFRRTADIRYVGQGFEVETELPTIMRESERYALEQRFSLAYAALFGRHLERQKLEVINWRVEGFADISSPPTVDGQYSASNENKQEKKRQAYFPDINAFVATPVIAESALMVGQTLEGPALIEQAGSTVVVGPGDQFSLDTFGNIRVVIGTRTKK